MTLESRTVRVYANTAQRSLILSMVIVGLVQSTYGQLRDSYKAAAETYRKAAQMTACEDRRRALLQNAEWNDCWIHNLETGSTFRDCGNAPSIPDCAGDKVGAVSPSMNSTQAGPEANQSFQSAISAAGNLMWNAMESKRMERKSFGTSVVRSFAQGHLSTWKNSQHYSIETCDECGGDGVDSWGASNQFSLPCQSCNGLGSKCHRAPSIKATQDNSAEFNALTAYMEQVLSSNSSIVHVDPPYDGGIDMLQSVRFSGSGDDLIIEGRCTFRFTNARGDDLSVTDGAPIVQDNYFDWFFPKTNMQAFMVLPADIRHQNGISVRYAERLVLVGFDGTYFEFVCTGSTSEIASRLNELLAAVK